MSEGVARAVGAAAPGEFVIAGKKCRVRPLTVKELTEITREGVRSYRRDYLEKIKDTIDLMDDGPAFFQAKIEESARWEAEDLPKKEVFDADSLQLNKGLQKWLVENLKTSKEKVGNLTVYRSLVSAALDSELLTAEEFKKLTGNLPRKIKTGWINWWTTATPDGMLSMIWHSVKADGITREEVNSLVSDPTSMMSVSREIEHLSVPSAGNG